MSTPQPQIVCFTPAEKWGDREIDPAEFYVKKVKIDVLRHRFKSKFENVLKEDFGFRDQQVENLNTLIKENVSEPQGNVFSVQHKVVWPPVDDVFKRFTPNGSNNDSVTGDKKCAF